MPAAAAPPHPPQIPRTCNPLPPLPPTLYPLYSLVLCDAVIMTPAAAPSCVVPKATKGVGVMVEKRATLTPRDRKTLAATSANSLEWWRASWPAIAEVLGGFHDDMFQEVSVHP